MWRDKRQIFDSPWAICSPFGISLPGDIGSEMKKGKKHSTTLGWAFKARNADPSPVRVVMRSGVATEHSQCHTEETERVQKKASSGGDFPEACTATERHADISPSRRRASSGGRYNGRGKSKKRVQTSTCKKCGGPIGWRKTKRGKWCPTSVNGGDHWDECREWRCNGTHGISDLANAENRIGWILTPGHEGKIIPPHPAGVLPWDDEPC